MYWIPVRNVLERGEWKFDLVLVNPQHVRALQGEKTDDKDCRRLAELGQHDLLRGSFLPPADDSPVAGSDAAAQPHARRP